MPKLKVIEPHGFCSGVKAAVEAAFAALEEARGETVWCLHELVHNSQVVESLLARGMVFVESLDEVPRGGTVLFSAHGVSPAVRALAAERSLRTIDATCPFVTRVHRQVRAFAADGIPVVIIGNAAHAEVAGTAGEAVSVPVFTVDSPEDARRIPLPPGSKVGVVAQTTLSADDVESVTAALKERFPGLAESPAASVCYATRDRQRAVRAFVEEGGQGVIVLGSATSSNTQRLVETALSAGALYAVRAGTMEEVEAVEPPPLESIGLTSGASTPEEFLQKAFASLKERFES